MGGWVVRVVQVISKATWTFNVALDCLSEAEGKSFLLKTPHTQDTELVLFKLDLT